jgi:hypothetical protein
VQFDELSKAVAAGLTRRRLIGLAGAGVGSGIFASVAPTAAAHGPGACQAFCGKTSFISGPAHASCLQACKKCGGNISGICTGVTGTSVCCADGTSCCVNSAGAPFCCPSGQICSGGVCVVPPSFCVPTCVGDTCAGSATSCSQACAAGTPGCACVSTVEGSACVQEVCTFVPCATSADCGAGSVCFTQGCCGA